MSKKMMGAVCLTALFAVSAFAQTADELIAKSITAQGGAEKMKSMKSMKMSGKMKMGPMEAPFVLTKARPDELRMDFTIQGMTATQAFDGTTGWMVMPFAGKKDAEKMPEDMVKAFRDEADFDGPMVDYKAKGNKVEYIGKEDVQGSPTYKLKVTTKSGAETMVFLDADSYLPIRSEGKRKMQGTDVETETTIGDYKEVEGMMFPHSIESHMKGKPAGQSIAVEKIELNPKIDSASFVMPKVAEKPKEAEPTVAEKPKKAEPTVAEKPKKAEPKKAQPKKADPKKP